MLQDNTKLREIMADYRYSKAEFLNSKPRMELELNGLMVKPPDFDPARKYPVLFTIYGGPGSQTVNNSWGTVSSWNQLWAQHGIIVVSVDNRGTGGERSLRNARISSWANMKHLIRLRRQSI